MRHRFEPARLVLGLSLIVIAALHLTRVTGHGSPPLAVLFALVPVALLVAAAVAVATHALRRSRRGGG